MKLFKDIFILKKTKNSLKDFFFQNVVQPSLISYFGGFLSTSAFEKIQTTKFRS